MAKVKIKGREVLADIRSGMDDAGLMQKYGLSSKGIIQLMGRLVSAGLLTPAELAERRSLAKTVYFPVFKCAECGEIHYSRFDICPTCGAIMQQLNK
ncbi:MAG: hypothetical protein RDU20_12825 [Desulfomonilaceae bacterium]|nr:hypothetical protein [Desulfomonilaceae bacterium]